jgi:hypothetical protein
LASGIAGRSSFWCSCLLNARPVQSGNKRVDTLRTNDSKALIKQDGGDASYTHALGDFQFLFNWCNIGITGQKARDQIAIHPKATGD